MLWGYALFFNTLLFTLLGFAKPSLVNDPNLDLTFKYPGPNCFATALYGARVYEKIRGVDQKEFSHVLKSSCTEVAFPKENDIGVFLALDFIPVHAFVYINEELAFEKQGVDYLGKSPIRIIGLESLKYRVEADPFCRRFGDQSCFNKLKYYRCVSFKKPEALKRFEAKLELILRGLKTFSQKDLREDLESLRYLDESVLESLDKQLLFIFTKPFKAMSSSFSS